MALDNQMCRLTGTWRAAWGGTEAETMGEEKLESSAGQTEL